MFLHQHLGELGRNIWVSTFQYHMVAIAKRNQSVSLFFSLRPSPRVDDGQTSQTGKSSPGHGGFLFSLPMGEGVQCPSFSTERLSPETCLELTLSKGIKKNRAFLIQISNNSTLGGGLSTLGRHMRRRQLLVWNTGR